MRSSWMSSNTHSSATCGEPDAAHGLSVAAAAAAEGEYLEAVANFPFASPEGFEFPQQAPLEDRGEDALYEMGYGIALALDCWTSAMEASILLAGKKSETAQARALAVIYLDATRTTFFKTFVVDPDDITGDFLRDVIERNDYSALRSWRLGSN